MLLGKDIFLSIGADLGIGIVLSKWYSFRYR